MKFLNQLSSSDSNENALSVGGSTHSDINRAPTTISGMSNKTDTSVASHTSGRHRKHRSRSTTRCEDKPRKKKHHMGSGSTSLVSIPNAIKLSMLNTGLISFGEFILFALFCHLYARTRTHAHTGSEFKLNSFTAIIVSVLNSAREMMIISKECETGIKSI